MITYRTKYQNESPPTLSDTEICERNKSADIETLCGKDIVEEQKTD